MTRPRRTAALAAQEAIAATSQPAYTDDRLDESDDDFCATRQEEQTQKKKRATRKKQKAVQQSEFVGLHQPASRQHLPAEIRAMIVKHLDDVQDFRTCHSLMCTTKSWHQHLAQGEAAELAWKARLEIIKGGPVKRAKKDLSYRETFTITMSKRCSSCWRTCTTSFANVWKDAPAGLNICTECRKNEDNYFHVVTEEILSIYGVTILQLRTLPSWQPAGVWIWAVRAFLEERRGGIQPGLAEALVSYKGRFEKSTIQDICLEHAFIEKPISFKLRTLVNNYFRNWHSDDVLDRIGDLAAKVNEVKATIDSIFQKLGVERNSTDLDLRDRPSMNLNATWCDNLLRKERSPEQFLEAFYLKRDLTLSSEQDSVKVTEDGTASHAGHEEA